MRNRKPNHGGQHGQPVEAEGPDGKSGWILRFECQVRCDRKIPIYGGTLKLSADIPQLTTGDPGGRFIISNLGGGIIAINGFNTTIDRAHTGSYALFTHTGNLAGTSVVTAPSGSWTSEGVAHQRILTDGPETWQATSASNPTGKLFWRLKVSQP